MDIEPARVPPPGPSRELAQLQRKHFNILTLPNEPGASWTPLGMGADTLPECRGVRLQVDLADAASLRRGDQPDIEAGRAQLSAFAAAVGAPPPSVNQAAAEALARVRFLEVLPDTAGIVPRAGVRVVPAVAGGSFPARKAYDLLVSMGLERVDFDCLALRNDTDIGDDFLVTVDGGDETLCFSDSRLASASFDALAWRMHVVRTPDPEAVFTAMWRGAEAAAEALGGRLWDIERDVPADRDAMAAEVARTAKTLRDAGLHPGTNAALVMSWE